MKILFIIFIGLSLFAEEIKGDPTFIYNYISSPHQEFNNPYCLQYHLRKSIDNQDLLLLTGFTLSSIKKELIEEENIKYYTISLSYTDSKGNTAPGDYWFKCSYNAVSH